MVEISPERIKEVRKALCTLDLTPFTARLFFMQNEFHLVGAGLGAYASFIALKLRGKYSNT